MELAVLDCDIGDACWSFLARLAPHVDSDGTIGADGVDFWAAGDYGNDDIFLFDGGLWVVDVAVVFVFQSSDHSVWIYEKFGKRTNRSRHLGA